MTQVRPLRWHDLPFAYRLAGRGVSFDAHLRLILGEDHFRYTQLTGFGHTQAYILRHSDASGLAGLYYPSGDLNARLAYLSPALGDAADEDLWLKLLDGLAVMAGRRGTVSIAAEVDEHDLALEVLRRADFAIYARQDIWLRQPAPLPDRGVTLRPVRPGEESSALALYGLLVPALIKQVEPVPVAACGYYLLDGREGPSAMVAVYRGTRRSMVELYLHPEVDFEAGRVIEGALAALQAETQPVYFRVRRYMGWLDHALADLGFEHQSSQAVMVRHIAVRVKPQPGFKPLPAMESVLVPTPIADLKKILAHKGQSLSPNERN